jgi:hypothetical protein
MTWLHKLVVEQFLGLVDEPEHLVVEVHSERSDGDVAVFSTGQGVDTLLQACEGSFDGLVTSNMETSSTTPRSASRGWPRSKAHRRRGAAAAAGAGSGLQPGQLG